MAIHRFSTVLRSLDKYSLRLQGRRVPQPQNPASPQDHLRINRMNQLNNCKSPRNPYNYIEIEEDVFGSGVRAFVFSQNQHLTTVLQLCPANIQHVQ